MLENFDDLKNIFSISDDSIVYGFEEDGSDHDTTLLKRARKMNCKFNPDKLRVWTAEISFFRTYHIRRWNKTRCQED